MNKKRQKSYDHIIEYFVKNCKLLELSSRSYKHGPIVFE